MYTVGSNNQRVKIWSKWTSNLALSCKFVSSLHFDDQMKAVIKAN